MLDAIVLAGAGVIKDSGYTQNKALLTIHGKTMIEYVVEALKRSAYIGRILVIGPREDLLNTLGQSDIEILEPDNSLIDNIVNGINYLGLKRDLLICSSDIPLLTSRSIDDFIERSVSLGADMAYPIVSKSLSEKYYPEMKRTYTRLKDGTFTGGNIFYINPKIFIGSLNMARALFDARKNPLKMARIISISLLVRLVTGTLTIEKAEKRFSKIINAKANAIISDYPELANDIDKQSDLLAASFHLAARIDGE